MVPNKSLVELKYLLQTESVATGVVTGTILSFLTVLQKIDWSRFLAPGWFSLTLLLLMTGEMLTCFYGKDRTIKKSYPWTERIRDKLFISSLAIVALILDSIIIAIVLWLPIWDGSEFPVWGAGFLPITISTLLWLNTAEAVKMVLNISRSTGTENIPPVILWVITQIRKVDAARLPPGAAPNKRIIDGITEDDIRLILARLEENDDLDPPPQPLTKETE